MSKIWMKHHDTLKAFIESTPEVSVTEELISIDESVRRDFYKHFNRVRTSFIAENYSQWLDEAEFLSTKYMKVEAQIQESLRLEEVLMPVDLSRFLGDPLKQVLRDLFDPLFELLQDKIERDEFEEKAHLSVQSAFRHFYQMGYVKWFVLSLIEKLHPEKLYEVPLAPPSSKQIIKHREDVRQNIPFPCETKLLGFEVGRRDVLLLPDFIVRSALFENYVAFRTDIGKAIWRASYHTKKREWFSISAIIEEYGITEIKPDLMLYLDDHLEDVSLVADSDKFCRPDLLVFFLDQLEGHEKTMVLQMERFRSAHEILKPLRGTCVISKHHLPESIEKRLDENMTLIHFGFNNVKWENVINILKN